MMRHSLSNIDTEIRIAECSVCGLTTIRSRGASRHGKPQWRCATAQNSYLRKQCKTQKGRQAVARRVANYRTRKPEKVKEGVRRWKKENPDRVLQHNALRRVREFQGFVEPVSRVEVAKRGNWLCGICRKRLGKRFHIDHIIPLSKGGKHEMGNVQATHAKCNLRKGANFTLPTSGA